MSESETPYPRHHHDAGFFAEALAFTSSQQGFVSALIEKDYFCSLVLAFLSALSDTGLVFKGGTCLTKVHTGFYRLSEDLDFTVPMAVDAPRAERNRKIEPAKQTLGALCDAMPEFREEEPLRGANSSRQYVGSLSYESLIHHRREIIKIEVSLREPLVEAPRRQEAATALLNPLSGRPLVPSVRLSCISKREALAEKFRAALTRREAAIRDYFDIDYAVRRGHVDLAERSWLEMLKDKLAVPSNESVSVSKERLQMLRDQEGLSLKPVLRTAEFETFDLKRAFDIVADVAVAIKAIEP